MSMPVDPGLGGRRRIGPDVAGIAVRQVESEEMCLPFDPIDDDQRLAEIGLSMPRWMGQRHEHLAASPLMLAHVILHDRVAAGEAMLIPQPLEDPFGRVALLAMDAAVGINPSIDDLGEPVQLRALHR